MQNFLRLCSIVSLVIVAIKIGIAGLLTPGWIAFILICGVLFMAGGRRVIMVTAAVASLVLFIRYYSGGNSQIASALTQSIFALVIVCVGFYVMFRGFFRSSNR